jgi:hypothetical protein
VQKNSLIKLRARFKKTERKFTINKLTSNNSKKFKTKPVLRMELLFKQFQSDKLPEVREEAKQSESHKNLPRHALNMIYKPDIIILA